MTQPITESYIKKHLDGWFFRYSPSLDRFERRLVPPDYIPDHDNWQAKSIAKCLATWRRDVNRKRGRNQPKNASDEEKAKILHLYENGYTIGDIHKLLKSEGSRASYRSVSAALIGVKAPYSSATPSLEQAALVRAIATEGIGYAAIQKRLRKHGIKLSLKGIHNAMQARP